MQVCRQWAGGAADGLRGHRAALVPVPVCCWQAVQVGGVICCGGGALAWSSSGPRGHRPGRAAADPAGRAGVRQGWKMGKRKRPGQAARCALLLWPLVCAGGAICCAGCTGAGGGRDTRVFRPIYPGRLALALIQAQRFQLATFQRGTGCAGGAPSGPFLPFAGGVRFST